jgi:hypothetical protein
MNEDYILLLKQEILYLKSIFLYCKWYRKLYGGTWYLIKFDKKLPDIRLFCIWTKIDESKWEKSVVFLEKEIYSITNVDNKYKLIKQFFKNIFSDER